MDRRDFNWYTTLVFFRNMANRYLDADLQSKAMPPATRPNRHRNKVQDPYGLSNHFTSAYSHSSNPGVQIHKNTRSSGPVLRIYWGVFAGI